jgi:hypothetical protein
LQVWRVASPLDQPVQGLDHPVVSPLSPFRAASARALLVALVLTGICAAWTRQAELVTLTSQISEATPCVASIMCLFLLIGLGALLAKLADFTELSGRFRGFGRWCRSLILRPGEILVVFVFLAIAAAMPGIGLFRLVMPSLMVPQYYGMPNNHLTEMAQTIPWQLAPTNPEDARIYWEGSDAVIPSLGLERIPVVGPLLEGVSHFLLGPTIVPWKLWAVPFLIWTFYITSYFIAAFCLVTIFRRHWEEEERLMFPMSSFAVEMIRPQGSLLSGHNFYRDPVVWTGFLLAVLYNTMSALAAINPALPALGISYPLGNIFTESPWNAMRGFTIFYKPELLGLGYLVPSDVLFSIWFFTLAEWVIRPFAKMVGYQPSGFPFQQEQAMGAFVILAVFFIWSARKSLGQILQAGLGSLKLDDSGEPLSHRFAVIGALVGMLVVFILPIVFGVAWWVAVVYFALMFGVLIVYCRNRAEMGWPVVWGYPLYGQRQSMVSFLGSGAFLTNKDFKSMTILTMFSWMQRTVNQALTSIGQEGCVAADRLGESRRTIARVVLLAIVIGIVSSFLVNLSAVYEFGGIVLSNSGDNTGGGMTQEIVWQFTNVSQWIDKPQAPDIRRITYTIVGGLLALGMLAGRRFWVRFPFHAGGFALANCHGTPFMFFPALLLWLVKTGTLHIGGVGLYRRAAPGFLAFTLGHIFSVGVWSLVGLYAGDLVRRYIVWFL